MGSEGNQGNDGPVTQSSGCDQKVGIFGEKYILETGFCTMDRKTIVKLRFLDSKH